jgi:PAS domain S-box-containing protein
MYSIQTQFHRFTFVQKVKRLFSHVRSAHSKQVIQQDLRDTIIDNLSLLVYVKNRVGVYEFVNQAFCDFADMTAEKIVGKDDEELGLFLNPGQIRAADDQVFITGQKKYIPLEPFTDKYGSLYWFQTTKVPCFDDKGKIKNVLITSTNITRNISQEQSLLKSELRYKSIFENNYSGIIVVNKELEIINKNKAFNKLVAKEQSNLADDDLKLYISKDDLQDIRDLMVGMVSRNYMYFNLPLDLNSDAGVKVNTLCFVRGLFDDIGNFTEAVITFQDVTVELKSSQALIESEKRFRVIVENATEALLLLNFDTKKYIDANRNATELFAYSKEEILEMDLGSLSPINQSDGSKSKELSQQYMQRALTGENVVYEWTVRRKDNKMIPCEVRLVRLPFEGSNIVRTSVIDITERKRAERMLNLEKQKLEETNNSLVSVNDKLEKQGHQLKEFAYISSHNLRSPAGNIRALLDFYKSEPTEDNLSIVIEKLDTVSMDLLETINDLANVVKIKNEIANDLSVLSIEKLVSKTKDSLSQQIIDCKATIKIELDGLDKIMASKTYMESIMLNLLSNAIKYAKADIPPQIHVAVSESNDYVQLSVSDNGSGIDLNKHSKKIFGLRKTFHRNRDSRGVGLFITKAQVEAMGGTIEVISKPDVGSTFTISLPKIKIS